MRLKTKFQDEDFELGEVVEADVSDGGVNGLKVYARAAKGGLHTFYLDSLKELTDMFEDYEELDEVWYIDWKGDIRSADIGNDWEREKAIDNYFLSKEEAEKAVERLQAWKRLKDKGFEFEGWKNDARLGYPRINWSIREIDKQVDKDLDICFGGEE